MKVFKIHLRGYRRVRQMRGRGIFVDTTLCGVRADQLPAESITEIYAGVTCKNCLRVRDADETTVPPYVREKNEPGRMVQSNPEAQPKGVL
jgi:hypothetical protein